MLNWKKLGVGLICMSISGCANIPDIIQVGDCEHGIVTIGNVEKIRAVWPEAQQTDVLISGGCYQKHFIKKER